MSLNPRDARRKREADAAAREAREKVLNAPFPFIKTSFDPAFFGLTEEPPATAKK